jgi:hypothetical protein
LSASFHWTVTSLANYLGNLAFNLVLNRHFAAAQASCEEAQGLVDEIGDRIQKTSRKWVVVFVPGGRGHTYRSHCTPRLLGISRSLRACHRLVSHYPKSDKHRSNRRQAATNVSILRFRRHLGSSTLPAVQAASSHPLRKLLQRRGDESALLPF